MNDTIYVKFYKDVKSRHHKMPLHWPAEVRECEAHHAPTGSEWHPMTLQEYHDYRERNFIDTKPIHLEREKERLVIQAPKEKSIQASHLFSAIIGALFMAISIWVIRG